MNPRDLRFENDPDFENLVRDELRRSIVPPATPASLAQRVDAIGAAAMARPASRFGMPRLPVLPALRGLAAVAVVAALVAGVLVWRGVSLTPPVAVTPAPSVTAGPSGSPEPAFPPSTGQDGPMSSLRNTADGLVAVVGTETRGSQVTDDGGKSWYRMSLPAGEVSLDFLNRDFAWATRIAAAATGFDVLDIYLSHDGGRSWHVTAVTDLPVTGALAWTASAHFADPERGVILLAQTDPATGRSSDCRLYTTDDGGAAWHADGEAPCITNAASPISWTSAQAGWIVPVEGAVSGQYAASGIWFTLDAGRTWRMSSLPGVPSGQKVTIEMMLRDGPEDARLVVAWLVQDGATSSPPEVVYRTTDGGETWTEAYRMALPTKAVPVLLGQTLVSFTALGAEHWRAAAKTEPLGGYGLFETFDGGRSWSQLPTAMTLWPDLVVWWDGRHGVLQGGVADCADRSLTCGGTGSVYLTDDGGRTWHRVPF